METKSCGPTDGRSSALWGKGSRDGGLGGKLRTVGVITGILAALAVPSTAFGSDTTAPTTKITSGPGNLALVSGPVTYVFATNEPAAVSCSLDRAPFGPCTTTTSFRVAAPYSGMHVFSVRATDGAGNVGRAVSRIWGSRYTSTTTYLPSSLFGQSKARPDALFDVIVQTATDAQAASVAQATSSSSSRIAHTAVNSPFASLTGFKATLPGWLVLYLAENWPILSITPDVKVQVGPGLDLNLQPTQKWQEAIKADRFWPSAVASLTAPTIAIVDSGIDASKMSDFGARVIGRVNVGGDGKSGDGDGHGTLVASVAAGANASYPGAAPTAKLLDVRAMRDDGTASTSDVIKAADWILANKDKYNIKVANFSLHSGRPNAFRFDPLDRAVESLWFNGVTVVAAAGNFGTDLSTPQKMFYAPGNDPFVITVGAADTNDTVEVADDGVAPWSAFGYTADGFAKPEVVGPGRYMVAAIPSSSKIAKDRKDKVVADGYAQVSGTSFAAAAVSGIAANLLALHPAWAPDQVKGALMSSAHRLIAAPRLAQGFGEVDEAAAAAVAAPPNPNAGLDRFVGPDASAPGGVSFDGKTWTAVAKADPAWNDMAWTDMTWTDMAWVSMAWTDAAQADAALADMAWTDASGSD